MDKHHNIENAASTLAKDILFFIDFLKAISILAVIYFHAVFVTISTYKTIWVDLESLFAPLKFCVPVLFTISFLLLERSIDRRRETNFWMIIEQRLIRSLGFETDDLLILKLLIVSFYPTD